MLIERKKLRIIGTIPNSISVNLIIVYMPISCTYFTPIMKLKFMWKVYCYFSIWLNITYFNRELLWLNWCVADYIYGSDCYLFSPSWHNILLWLLLSKLSSWIRKFKHLVGREVIFISTVTQFYFNIFTQHSFLI